MKTGQLRNLIRETIKEISEDAAEGLEAKSAGKKLFAALKKEGLKPVYIADVTKISRGADASTQVYIEIKGNNLTISHPTKNREGVDKVESIIKKNGFNIKRKANNVGDFKLTEFDISITTSEDAAMKKSALGMAMYGKKSKMERARYKDGGSPLEEAPSGQVDVFSYTTKNFDICPGAQSLYKKLSTESKYKDKETEIIQLAKDHDELFGLEKKAIKDKKATDSDVSKAQEIAKKIMDSAKKLNLDREHNYVQGHVDKIKDIKDGKENKETRSTNSADPLAQLRQQGRTTIGPRNPAPTYESLTSMANKLGYINEGIKVKSNTEFKIALKHLLQKHAVNLKRGKADTEFKLTLKHLLDKHVSKGGEEKND